MGLLRSELQRLPIAWFFAGSSRESFRFLFVSDSSPFSELTLLEAFNFARATHQRPRRRMDLQGPPGVIV